MSFPQDDSIQLSYSSFPFIPTLLDNYATSNFVSNVSNVLRSAINTKQDTLTAATSLLGSGGSITGINYNTLSNLPTTFPPTMTNLYNRIEIDNISNANSNYTSITSNILSNLINTKQNTLTASTILSGIGSNLTLINYNTLSNLPLIYTRTESDNRYLQLSGGNLTGNLGIGTTDPKTLLHVNGKTLIHNAVAVAPANGIYGNDGTRIVLWPGATDNVAYSLGIANGTLWYAVPTGAIHAFYTGTTERLRIDTNGNFLSTADIRGIKLVAGGTSYQLLIDPPSATSASTIQTIQQGVGFNQNLTLQATAGNVGIGITNPSSKLHVNGNTTINGDLILKNGTWHTSIDGIYRLYFGANTTTFICSGGNAGDNGLIVYGSAATGYATNLAITNSGNATIRGTITTLGQLIYNYLFNNTGGTHGDIADFNNVSHFGYKFIQGTTNGPGTPSASQYYSWFIGLGNEYPATGAGSYGAQFALPRNTTNPVMSVRFKENNAWTSWSGIAAESVRFKTDLWNISTDGLNRLYYGTNSISYYQGYGNSESFSINHDFRNHDGSSRLLIYYGGTANAGARLYGQFTCGLYTIANANRDLVGVNIENTNTGNYNNTTLYIIQGTFTGFHRCFTEDELFDKEEPQLFKDNYEGRIVISTGKIATDTNENNRDWEIKYDKDGITIEDALPQIELSRKKKDKRVFGVLGDKRRSNSRKERLIINSVGEGAVWCINSSGNFQNGDLITTSDYLGYGELQDSEFITNYTCAKITMDCDFQLDSDLYECKEIDDLDEKGNKLRVAFVACVYYAG